MGNYTKEHFINRELSWLAFNERVLEEAEDSSTPLLNRLGFLSIVSSNLDEFVMVRVGGLMQARRRGRRRKDISGMTAVQQLNAIARRIKAMVKRQYECFNDAVRPALADRDVRVLRRADFSNEQVAHLTALFDEQIYPLLTPMALDETRGISEVPGLTMCVLVRLTVKSGNGEQPDRVAVVPLAPSLPRVLALPGGPSHQFALLEDVVLMFLHRLFEGYSVEETALFRITRDADMSVEESSDEDFVAAMTDVLIQRRSSPVVRLEISSEASRWASQMLAGLFEVGRDWTFTIPGPLDLKPWFTIVNTGGLDELRYPRWRPQPSPALPSEGDMFDAVRAGDILLHHPYESFDAVVSLLQQAAADRNVLAIKQVLYRTSGDSPVIGALEEAASAGKQVSVLVELKARFDEARNIKWAKRLERAGAQVIYGLAGLKVHAKALLIIRREPDRIRRYVHMGTGNYNDATAKLYTDFGMLTCREDFGDDVAAFFNMVTGYSQPAAWRKIEVAPLGLRPAFLHLIGREAERAQSGRRAAINAKVNSLSDPEIIEALYDASEAGVKIRLNVRGICCLRPGVEGVSENIKVVSIVDQFLEHSRIFHFLNGGDDEVYLASADWMTRNIDRRVETMFPVETPALRKRLIDVLDIFINDNVKGRALGPDGMWSRPQPPRSKSKRLRAQGRFMELAEEAARRSADRVSREFRPIKASGAG
jgi:polyphosphate kinase